MSFGFFKHHDHSTYSFTGKTKSCEIYVYMIMFCVVFLAMHLRNPPTPPRVECNKSKTQHQLIRSRKIYFVSWVIWMWMTFGCISGSILELFSAAGRVLRLTLAASRPEIRPPGSNPRQGIKRYSVFGPCLIFVGTQNKSFGWNILCSFSDWSFEHECSRFRNRFELRKMSFCYSFMNTFRNPWVSDCRLHAMFGRFWCRKQGREGKTSLHN
jgi:hypothetical protein